MPAFMAKASALPSASSAVGKSRERAIGLAVGIEVEEPQMVLPQVEAADRVVVALEALVGAGGLGRRRPMSTAAPRASSQAARHHAYLQALSMAASAAEMPRSE